MTSEAELAALVDVGFDHTTFRLFVVGLTALLVYDYFLTLKDEVRYGWRTENVPIFVIYLFTRYLPIAFQVWLVIFSLDPGYTSEACAKTIFITSMYNDIIMTLSQIILTLRAYAITMRNKLVAGILCTISAVEFCVGVYMFVYAAVNPLPTTSTIPLALFNGCALNIGKYLTIIQMVLPLTFEITAFLLVFVQAQSIKSRYREANASTIVDRINRDSEIYFVFITSCNFLAVVMYFTVKSMSTRGLPVIGNMVLMPVMICRMVMSLRKAADSTRPHMSVEAPAESQTGNSRYSHSSHPVNIKLAVFKR